MQLNWGVASLRGKKNRPNEDRYRVLHAGIPLVAKAGRGEVFAVFDGIGSSPRGGESAQAMCDALSDFFLQTITEEDDGVSSLERILRKTNEDIYAWGHSGSRKPAGGCAGTVAWFQAGQVIVLHAGDTAAFLLKEDIFLSLTRDHGSGRYLDNYFGRGASLVVDVITAAVEEGETVVLMSDGITKVLSQEEIGDTISRFLADNVERAANELCRLAQRRGSQDDITALVVEIEEVEAE